MTRFFLNIRKPDGELIQGDQGAELTQLGRARETAIKVAVDLVRENPETATWAFEITDEVDRIVLSENVGKLAAMAEGST
jgi:hypothetical protein